MNGLFKLPAIAFAMNVGIALMFTAAEATPISGGLGLGGVLTILDASDNNVSNFADAVKIDFDLDVGTVGVGYGDLSLFANKVATLKDFVFAPPPGGTLLDFVKVSSGGIDFVFDVDNTSLNSVVSYQGNSQLLTITGSGTAHLTGYDDTYGEFSLTTQRKNGTTNQRFSWSNAVDVAQVPEPGSLAVLGAGLLGLGVIRRRRSTAA